MKPVGFWIRTGVLLLAAFVPAFADSDEIRWRSAREFWAFRSPVRHPAPPVRDASWPKNQVDRFVLAELEAHGLKPVRPAGKGELIRRATFDLIGLPPTIDEIAAFEKDDSPTAFARVVDRLLASAHYGERWGRYWLDVARYADDKALAFANPWPHAYRYRDWVVARLNDDMPYDRFVRLQLAGDLIQEPTTDYTRRLAGLGFQGLGAVYHKGSVPEQVKADELDDRIDTLSRGLLGLTVACARCHDHKYDPIPTRDYYSLAAAYNGAAWNEIEMASAEDIARYNRWKAETKRKDAALKSWVAEQGRAISRSALAELDRYLLAAWRIRAGERVGEKHDRAQFAATEKLRLRFLNACVGLLDTAAANKKVPVLAGWASAAVAALGQVGSAGQPVATPESLRRATEELVAKVRAALSEHDRVKDVDKLSPQHRELLKALWLDGKATFAVSEKDVPALLSAAARGEYEKLQEDRKRHTESAPPAPPRVHGVTGGGRTMHINIRGNVERKGDAAPPGFLRILAPPSTGEPARQEFTRLELADAICSPENPLTARVIVNRVWQHHFGRGIVATASNFGAVGDRPTHAELLDTLAVRFMRSGWSLKWLHRELMLSATYQLGAHRNPRNMTADPDNRFLWRFSPRRLDVEAWRDAILAVSGRLDRTMGGPAAGGADAGQVRRTLYGTVSRREPDRMLVAFDFPDANVSCERRDVTTVPQQQLFVLNSSFVIRSAEALAARLQQAAATDEERIELMYRWAFARRPTAEETELSREFLSTASLTPTSDGRRDQLSPWGQLAQAILAANEFTWID